ncbi:hypothetical protein [Clostridium botulinum]|uniref:hypothetical protein n=1 Tax=Clostridium botulinum TaxID=1491 RepID=UPI001C9AA3C9|nr:hypothetical protein [Clostridium botulinum]MBY6809369.1 hypothetical protein [Clostridium botulinum]MBY6822811.1 hypothetical protein [Clostridium botulinum]MBY6833423.1 hypothetical protein [Clostridium botulinum]MBY6971484.1 hypothetical protein [Clostridium botulinum]HBJ1649199.1 hypothetical protein [Clostridium botulinum]
MQVIEKYEEIINSKKTRDKPSYNAEELLKYYESMTGFMSCLTSVIVRADFEPIVFKNINDKLYSISFYLHLILFT